MPNCGPQRPQMATSRVVIATNWMELTRTAVGEGEGRARAIGDHATEMTTAGALNCKNSPVQRRRSRRQRLLPFSGQAAGTVAAQVPLHPK